jgi:16S rRNA (cytidine1402-2'-O)-methyltransferase
MKYYKNKDSTAISTGLYIVPTPIGNLRDITLRAIDVLRNIDIIVCESTRITIKLLSSYSISKPLITYNDYNAQKQINIILDLLKKEKSIALVSDSGTPLISDPGYKLSLQINRNGYNVFPLPGPCSIITALIGSQLPTNKFFFIGFLPQKKQAKIKIIESIKTLKTTIILFESPKRLNKTVLLLQEYLGNRRATIAKEISKVFECFNNSSLDLLTEKTINIKGECILLVEGYSNKK